MTTEEALKRLPIIQAYAEGKTVQSKPIDRNTWWDHHISNVDEVGCPAFFISGLDFRIKPDPWEGWIALDTKTGHIYPDLGPNIVTSMRRIKVREVTE